MKKLILIFLVVLFIKAPDDVIAADIKYIWEKPSNQSIAGADSLIQDLNNEVQKLVDKGHVESGYFNVGLGGEFELWSYPGEIVYTLSSALPYLNEPLKTQATNYINSEILAHSPVTQATLHNNGGCCIATLGGTRREFFPLDPNIQLNLWPPATVPLDGIYMIWEYVDKTGNWDYVSNNWNAIVNLYNNTSGAIDTFGEIGGTIGMARLANKMNQAPYNKTNAPSLETDAVVKASSALDNFNFVTEANEEQAARGNSNFNWNYPVFCYEQGRNILVGCFFSKEVGRYLASTQQNQIKTEVEYFISSNAPHGVGYDPGWFLTRADFSYFEYHNGLNSVDDNRGLTTPTLGHESSIRTPEWSWTWYMIRAHILKDDAQTLSLLVDAPQAIGDLYYMQKLVSAIEAYGQECWTDVRTNTTTCTGSAPTPCQNADINQDSIVDLSDYSLIALNFFSTSPSNPKADISGDGVVDLTDYSLLSLQFLKVCS